MEINIRFDIGELFLLEPGEAAINFFTIFKVGFTVKFGEPFLFCVFHEDS